MTKRSFLYEFRTRRLRRSFASEGTKIHSPTVALEFLRRLITEADREFFFALYLDAKGHVIGYEQVAVGTMSSVEVHPRELFRGAILAGAFAVVLAHNHPSGDPSPSPEDLMLTERMRAVGALVGIEVLDHVVICERSQYSMAEQGDMVCL